MPPVLISPPPPPPVNNEYLVNLSISVVGLRAGAQGVPRDLKLEQTIIVDLERFRPYNGAKSV